jgi:DNA-binding transcriptional LysR family regulator
MRRLIDSRQLLAFATLARRGSFTLTAKEIFLTQSAVSHTIKGLERELGARLFDRVGKRVHLTQAGEQLLHHADRILREMEAARAGLEQLENWGQSRLRIGASPTACQYLLPTVLREFKQSFPKCVIRIEPGDGPQMVELLRDNEIDLAIMVEPARHEDIVFRRVFEDELRLIVPPLHPWGQAGRVPRGEISEATLILYNKASYTFRMVADYFARDEITLRNPIELGSMEAIKELVKLGVGIGVLAPWIAQKELAERSLVALPLGSRRLRRVWGVAHLKGRRLALAEETFAGLCESVAETLNLTTSAAA